MKLPQGGLSMIAAMSQIYRYKMRLVFTELPWYLHQSLLILQSIHHLEFLQWIPTH